MTPPSRPTPSPPSPPQNPTSPLDVEEVAQRMAAVLAPFADQPVGRKLRLRLRELGDNVLDERKQFRLLQRACQESPPLAAAFETAGFGPVATLDTLRVTPAVGLLVQAFNHVVENLW
jgi:hypothetical protein